MRILEDPPNDISNMIENRAHPRLSDLKLVMIGWGHGLEKRTQLANVRDVSLRGIGLLIGSFLPVGTPVTISYYRGDLTGIVRHNSELVDGNCIGVEFTEESKNSVARFESAHAAA